MEGHADPFTGKWECMPMKGMDDKFAIDATILQTQSGRYMIWSGWAGYENIKQDLYLAEMVSPVEVKPEKILLSEPEYSWEKVGNPLINEGPQIVIRKDTINLVYSASGSWTNDYCLGLLTAKMGDDVKDPQNWEKSPEPVFSSANGIYGPGHGSYVSSPDEKEDILVYHSARWVNSGWNRSIRYQKVFFDKDGKLLPAEPISSDTCQGVPSGEPGRLRFLSEEFELTGNLQKKEMKESLSPLAVIGFEDENDSMTLTFSLSEEQEATLYLFARVEDYYDEDHTADLSMEINDQLHTLKLYPSMYFQPVLLKIRLEKGENQLSISSKSGLTISVDRVEVGER